MPSRKRNIVLHELHDRQRVVRAARRAAGAGCPSVVRSCPTSRASPRRAARRRSGRSGTRPSPRSRLSNGASAPSTSAISHRSTFGHSAGKLHRHLALGRRRHDDARLAVVDDVGDLVRREVRVDARVVEAGALGAALALEHPRVVLEEERDVVAGAATPAPDRGAPCRFGRLPRTGGRSRPRRCSP